MNEIVPRRSDEYYQIIDDIRVYTEEDYGTVWIDMMCDVLSPEVVAEYFVWKANKILEEADVLQRGR